MATYKVKHTNKNKPAINIPEQDVNSSVAVKLFGRKKLSYGKDLNENLLRLLESFACPQVIGSNPPVPDVSKATDNMFENPVNGQLWYNSTSGMNQGLYYYFNGDWLQFNKMGELAANWGVIYHGAQIPLPISSSGKTYTYSECSWIVSPFGYPNSIDYMSCKTDENAVVKMEFSLENDPTIYNGFVNYLIVAIPGNVNRGTLNPVVTPTPTTTPTSTPASTPAPTASPTSTPASTPPVTPSPTPMATPTPTPTPSFEMPVGGCSTCDLYGPNCWSQDGGCMCEGETSLRPCP